MASTYDKASLILIPSGTKEGVVFSQKPTNGDGDFTFTRASSATRVNSDGLIEKERGNTTIYSQDANNWSSQQATRDSSNESDPFGGTSAAQYTATGVSAGYLFVTSQPSWSSGQVVTGSVYVRDIDSTYVQLTFGTAAFGSGQYQNFDLSSGTKGTGAGMIDSTITSVGGGWYRLSITAQANVSASSGVVIVFVPSASSTRLQTPNAGQTLQIFGIQTELGLVATDYIETTTAAVYEGITDNIPRLDYTDASCPSLLLEPQRTNVVTQSEYFADASWSKNNTTVTANAETSPDGYANTYKIVPNTSLTTHRITQTVTASGTCTASFFVKADGYKKIGLQNNVAGGGQYFTADISTKQKIDGNETSYSFEDYENGFVRVTVSMPAGTTQFGFFFYVMNDSYTTGNPGLYNNAGDGTSGVYLWGAQVEEGSYPTSYIPTYGASVTRVADATIKSNISNLIGQTEGTIFIEFDAEEDAPQNMNLINFNNSTQASVLIAKRTSGALRAQVFAGGSSLVDINSAVVSGKTKAAFAYKSGDSVLYVNGVAVANSNTFTFNGTLSEVIFPSYQAYFNFGHKYSVNKAILFKTRLSNEELADLTTI